MTDLYEKAAPASAGLRLHLNENTAGCSAAVMRALRQMTPEAIACYPDYSIAIAAVARHFGVSDSEIVLSNGLDEGILAACLAATVDDSAAQRATGEAIVVVPAFDMQGACARTSGLHVVEVTLERDFTFPTARVIDAISAGTRIIFITTPNNPTGLFTRPEEIAAVADAAPHALIFVDEAYADFGQTTIIGSALAGAQPNIVIGRTFSKAYGLAGLRCGALVGRQELIERIRTALSPYSVNAAATVALRAALEDREHYEWYLSQVRESKAIVYAAFDRLGIEYWRSEANFVLARFGSHAPRVCIALAARGIHVRDRSTLPLCGGCVRVTTGVVAHTMRFVEAIEELLCAAR